MRIWAIVLLPLFSLASSPGKDLPSPASEPFPPRYTLRADRVWQMNAPHGKEFDASALLRRSNGQLLTLSDRGPSVYAIGFRGTNDAVELIKLPQCFTPEQLAPFARAKIGRYDCEGTAEDAEGRIYICEEENRWILRWTPSTRKVERLPIDFSPVAKYFSKHVNASFEGIAIGEGKLYVANERSVGFIIVIDLASLKITDHFIVRPAGSLLPDVHYSDLSWFDGALYALLRENRKILKINPALKKVLAEYDFAAVEAAPDVAYATRYPFVGVMEGLAVDQEYFWLCTDNNGLPRKRFPNDIRPTLFRCRRPDLSNLESPSP